MGFDDGCLTHEHTEYEHSSEHWDAHLQLRFALRNAKTVLTRRRHHGPLTMQRPFYPEGGLCHVYLLHPPGGVVAGDRLGVDINAESGTRSLITTPGAGKFYRSVGKTARQNIRIQLQAEASLEWLPQETIVFNGARLQSSTQVHLAKGAGFIGWELTVLGRPAAQETFTEGEALLNWRFFRDGEPLFLEKMRLDASAYAALWGLRRRPVCATLFVYSANEEHLQAIRNMIGEHKDFSATLIEDLLICRAVGDNAASIRQFFEQIRAQVRRDIIGLDNYQPRIWAT